MHSEWIIIGVNCVSLKLKGMCLQKKNILNYVKLALVVVDATALGVFFTVDVI